ncbi:MAG: GTP-binding protein [Silvanigrellaceae bacterium]|nr:GTP-binding protein [Silvanigrellaceae bacterium]
MFTLNSKTFQSSQPTKENEREIPVTVVTGFLGSGKTTLLNRILQENHGKKIAVVLNEIGEVNLDSELVVQSIGEEYKIMNNGCVCCTVRDDLSKICKDLVKKKIDFEHLVIETTGMADPSPVAQTFFMDEFLQKHFYLDAVVTVVDSMYIHKNLQEIKETAEQIGFADVIILNKADSISKEQLEKTENDIKKINAVGKIFKTNFCNVPIHEVLAINAFNLQARIEVDPKIMQEYHEHSHDEQIHSIYLEELKALDSEKINRFMSLIVNELGNQILRYKGVLNIHGEENRVVFQGVHMTMGSGIDRPWEKNEERKTKMVFIGRHLPVDILKEGLSLCVAN